MTNVKLLREAIKSRGVTFTFIAQRLNITPQALSRKLDDGSDFKAWQMLEIKEILHLTDEEVKNIFFAEKVD